MNVLCISGRLVRDSELRFLKDGKQVLSFSVASNSGYGESKKTNYFECSIFGARGEKLADYMKKGQEVAVSGEITLNEYQTTEGETKASLRVRVNDITLVGSSSGAHPAKQETRAGSNPVDNFADYDDSLPF